MNTASASASVASAAAQAQPPPPVLFYDASRAAIVGSVLLLFSRQEYALLRALVGCPRVQSPEDLALRIYGRVPGAARSIPVLVWRLRRKLADRGVLGLVQNVRAQGYILADAVRAAAIADAEAP